MTNRRRKSGNLPSKDHGTPELIAKRAALCGSGDPAFAEYPLGVLFVRSIIDRDQHDCGVEYATLYGVAVRKRTTPAAVSLLGLDPSEDGEFDEAKMERLEREFRAIQGVLQSAGSRARNAVENIAVYHRMPYWLAREIGQVHVVRGSELAERRAILEGLSALVSTMRGRKAA